jgi:dolichol-phosphate mannosyltransferase
MKFNSLFLFLKRPEIYKFSIVGISNSILVLSLTAFFTEFLHIFYLFSVLFAYEVSIMSSFFMNDNWTFSQIKKSSRTYIRFVKYNTFSLIGLGINLTVVFVLTNFMGIYYILSVSIAILITFVFNYTTSKKIAFKN